ncbi:hypothetical protein GmRootV59_19850 [Variovorax sp. V59]
MERPISRLKLIQELSADERRWQPDPADWLKEQDNLAGDKTHPSVQHAHRINLNEVCEIRDWTHALGVSEQELRNAVAVVGDRADRVREFLTRRY